MFDDPNNSKTDQQRTILRQLRVWIAALAIACLLAGIGIGAMLSGRPTVAQSEMQIARAPEALSASFAEIARRVERRRRDYSHQPHSCNYARGFPTCAERTEDG